MKIFANRISSSLDQYTKPLYHLDHPNIFRWVRWVFGPKNDGKVSLKYPEQTESTSTPWKGCESRTGCIYHQSFEFQLPVANWFAFVTGKGHFRSLVKVTIRKIHLNLLIN